MYSPQNKERHFQTGENVQNRIAANNNANVELCVNFIAPGIFLEKKAYMQVWILI